MSGNPQGRLRPFQPMTVGNYRLLSPLATGGMGELFLARALDAPVTSPLRVVKRIRPEMATPEFAERFLEEAKTLAQLAHTSINQILDLGVHDGQPFLALEYVQGKDLRKVVARARERGAPLPLELCLYVFGRVLEALAYAHQKTNLVHRDVSPANIVIAYDGDVKVVDFGLAKSRASAELTHPSLVLGKFLYMAPEQARREKVDQRSDVYAAAMVLYELLAGVHPYENVSPGALMDRVMRPTFRHEEAFKRIVPPPLYPSLHRALDPNPETRLPSADAFLDALYQCGALPAHAGPEALGLWMREAFASEYVTERKLLASLGETQSRPPQSGHPTPIETPQASVANLPTPADVAARRTTSGVRPRTVWNLRFAFAVMAGAALLYLAFSLLSAQSETALPAPVADEEGAIAPLSAGTEEDEDLPRASARLHQRFARLSAQGGCNSSGGAPLCARYRELSLELSRGGDSTTLLSRVRSLSSEIEALSNGEP